MRIAALSDVHGNVWALEAVLRDVRRVGADVVVNAGDLLSGPLEPAATADLLMGLRLATVSGNHERQLLACAHVPGSASDRYAFEHTAERHRAWIAALPRTLAVADGAALLCHGTPASDRTYFLEAVDRHGGVRLAPVEAVEERARGFDHHLIVCGHSHLPRVHALSGGRVLVNPGSVGLPAYEDDEPAFHAVENGSPHARYALCEQRETGWDVSLRCVEYDFRKAAATARRNGRDDWARWIETGRA